MLLMMLAGLMSAEFAIIPAMLAAVIGSIGIIVERWLFFTEAKHVVTLYHGAEAA